MKAHGHVIEENDNFLFNDFFACFFRSITN